MEGLTDTPHFNPSTLKYGLDCVPPPLIQAKPARVPVIFWTTVDRHEPREFQGSARSALSCYILPESPFFTEYIEIKINTLKATCILTMHFMKL